ncbi:unnamed protein product [Somion occarium]|uniref:Uncharacterized protein n=1 Tax=Somion occarium TaxID=3059160 RepID=A0ABP1E0C6_9APHY
MNRRPFATHKRPLSAIFIGSLDSNSTASPPELPVLPASPSASSNGSGLPSPPATNSTGSGSVGEDSPSGSRARRKAASGSASEMFNGSYNKSQTSLRPRTANLSDDEDDLHDNEHDEDDTARFSLERKRSSLTSTTKENISALQRVRSLTQRNRMVLDKLSSISRLSSPAPSNSSRSPFSPPSNTSPSAASYNPSRLSSSTRPQISLSHPSNTQLPAGSSSSVRQDRHDHTHSGSETEREPEAHREYGHHYSSSDSMSATPTTSYSEARPGEDRFVRQRPLSASDTPDKSFRNANPNANWRNREPSRDRERSRGPSPGPSRTPRKRVSIMSMREPRYADAEDDDEKDVAGAALAAVASSRKSPRNRNPLPKEFRENDRSTDGKEPTTPLRNRDRERALRRSPSPRSPRASTSTSYGNNSSPRKYARSSTVRELTRKHQTRWLSEDLSAQDHEGDTSGYGRKQGHKTASSESPLTLNMSGGRSLVNEGLRAAGLTRRKDGNDDPFAGNATTSAAVVPRRTRSTGSGSILNGEPHHPPPAGHSFSRVSESVGGSRNIDPRTPAQRQDRNVSYSGGFNRPGTSMAALHSDEPRTAPAGLRTYRSSYPLQREPSSSSSYQASDESSRTHPTSVHDRLYSSPFGGHGNHTAPLPATAMGSKNTRDPHMEHRRLMLDALSMFESHLSRLPPMGQTTTSTIPEVFQTSQHLIHTTDKLNTALKAGTNQALEAQIDAEVSDSNNANAAEIWARVGMEYRDNLRLSDEVVRTMTAFLLGVGKVLREATTSANAHQQQHSRTMSLDDDSVSKARSTSEGVSAGTLSVDRRSSDGRRSRETRRSWDPRETSQVSLNLGRLASRERTNGGISRPGSSMNQVRSAASSNEARSVSDDMDHTPQTIRVPSSLLSSSSVRKPYTPRDQRTTSDPSTRQSIVLDSPDSYEPSPTPAPRNVFDRSRALPPLAIPPSLPTLPSESLLRRSATSSTSASTDKSTRRKISSNSNVTVRAEASSSSSFQPIIKPSNPTTAVTPHTVSHSPETSSTRLPRNDSASSFNHTNGVTFSRPSTISVSTLSGLQQQHDSHSRQRTSSTSSVEEPISAVSALRSPMSGSETERPRTVGLRGRVSLDKSGTPDRGSITASSSQASTLLSSRKERRRTITEIFQR